MLHHNHHYLLNTSVVIASRLLYLDSLVCLKSARKIYVFSDISWKLSVTLAFPFETRFTRLFITHCSSVNICRFQVVCCSIFHIWHIILSIINRISVCNCCNFLWHVSTRILRRTVNVFYFCIPILPEGCGECILEISTSMLSKYIWLPKSVFKKNFWPSFNHISFFFKFFIFRNQAC